MYTVFPKCLLVSAFALSAICSKNGRAAGDSRTLKSAIPQLSLARALLTSSAV